MHAEKLAMLINAMQCQIVTNSMSDASRMHVRGPYWMTVNGVNKLWEATKLSFCSELKQVLL